VEEKRSGREVLRKKEETFCVIIGYFAMENRLGAASSSYVYVLYVVSYEKIRHVCTSKNVQSENCNYEY
jgi:hypothetical protein